jgi:hypothetical protein
METQTGQVSASQLEAWRELWRRLLLPEKTEEGAETDSDANVTLK